MPLLFLCLSACFHWDIPVDMSSLWRMGVPPEIKDFIEKQIESELGINLEKLSGDEKIIILKR